MSRATTIFKTKVPTARLRKANAVLQKLGLDTGKAFNLMLAQIEIRKGLPCAVALSPELLLSVEDQAEEWTKTYGEY